MGGYLGRLIAQTLAALLVASAIIFFLLRVLPGDAAAVALGVNATPEALAAWRERTGTDRPLIAQYGTWLLNLFRGDFGSSFVAGREISPLILDRIQVTLILVVLSLILALLIAIPLGALAAIYRHNLLGSLVSAASQIGVAIPAFLLGMLLVALFSVRLGWLPTGGWLPPAVSFTGFLSRVALPVVTLGLIQGAILTRYVRSAVVDLLHQDYMRTALSVGFTRWRALWVHGLRNVAIPIITVSGVQFAALLVGAVVVERVFVIPGIGSMLVDAVANRDLPTVQGIVMLLVGIVIVVNLLTELAYFAIDPRLRDGEVA